VGWSLKQIGPIVGKQIVQGFLGGWEGKVKVSGCECTSPEVLGKQ
jgi:hypothetical protein